MSDTVTVKPLSRRENLAPKGRFPVKWVLIGLGAAVVLTVIGVFFYALQIYDKIYPGVTMRGVDLGGMTVAEASAALDARLAPTYDGKSLSVTVDDRSATLSAEDMGVRLSAETAARNAFDAGRSGGFFTRAGFVISSLFSQHSVESSEDYYIDRDAVQKAVAELVAPLLAETVPYVWSIGADSIEVTAGRTGRSADEAAIVSGSLERFAAADFTPLVFSTQTQEPDPLPLDDLFDQIYREPVSAYLDLAAEGGPSIIPHADGVDFDREAAQKLAEQDLPAFSIPLRKITPSVTLEQYQATLFRDVLSEYKTDTKTSSQNRADNITLTAQSINDTIYLPGDVFSFNGVVGNRTVDKGYKMAGSYISGKYVEQVGGGICQTSSTLYNAVLLANLEIVYRQNHSLTIGYVPLGQDATVNWDNIDFTFSNNTGYPIMIQATHENRTLVIRILGTKTDDTAVSIESVILSHTPYKVITEENPDMAPGARRVKAEGHHGYTVQTYRVLKAADGTVISRTAEAKSYYGVINEIVEVGPGTPTGGEIPIDPVTPSDPDPGDEPPITYDPDPPSQVDPVPPPPAVDE